MPEHCDFFIPQVDLDYQRWDEQLEQAIENIKDAIAACLQVRAERGMPSEAIICSRAER